jgi:hypothetical protein
MMIEKKDENAEELRAVRDDVELVEDSIDLELSHLGLV